jgi:hypothetical protein
MWTGIFNSGSWLCFFRAAVFGCGSAGRRAQKKPVLKTGWATEANFVRSQAVAFLRMIRRVLTLIRQRKRPV